MKTKESDVRLVRLELNNREGSDKIVKQDQ
jgi:hypothetical protein